MKEFRKEILALLIAVFFVPTVFGQQAYWVFLTDKDGVDFDPYAYFDQKAIERRMRNNLPLSHYSDWPLNESYIQEVKLNTDSILGQSRWFNAIAVIAKPEQIENLYRLKCVKQIDKTIHHSTLANIPKSKEYQGFGTKQLVKSQLESMRFSAFKEAGIDGKGVRIAIFDAGFPGVKTSPALRKIVNEGRIIKTWDFTKDREDVFYSNQHGTNVMSNIGGIYSNGEPIGMATGAEFLLAKTEVSWEPFSEEKNWLEAAEWADKNGADIINSSLGYTKHRYFQEDMDGKKSLVARAANMAASKGILVVNAAGNDGSNKWVVIGTPADADSVLAVGGVDPKSLLHIDFSSFGPNVPGDVKPNICAFGTAIVANKQGSYNSASGTSFASPLVAGFSACAIQVNPNMKTMELFHLIEQSGHLYPYFDYAHGYGIPQADFILKQSKDSIPSSFEIIRNKKGLQANILFPKKFQIGEFRYLYVNIMNKEGKVLTYKVIRANSNTIELYSEYEIEDYLHLSEANKLIVNVFYAGCTRSLKFRRQY